jgi:hypothetical protein
MCNMAAPASKQAFAVEARLCAVSGTAAWSAANLYAPLGADVMMRGFDDMEFS